MTSSLLFGQVRICAATDLVIRHRCIPGEQANIGKVLMVMESQWQRDHPAEWAAELAARAVDKLLAPSFTPTPDP